MGIWWGDGEWDFRWEFRGEMGSGILERNFVGISWEKIRLLSNCELASNIVRCSRQWGS